MACICSLSQQTKSFSANKKHVKEIYSNKYRVNNSLFSPPGTDPLEVSLATTETYNDASFDKLQRPSEVANTVKENEDSVVCYLHSLFEITSAKFHY
jgi:hypothetical protein